MIKIRAWLNATYPVGPGLIFGSLAGLTFAWASIVIDLVTR